MIISVIVTDSHTDRQIVTDSHTDRQIVTVSLCDCQEVTVSVGNSNVLVRKFNFKKDVFILIKLIKNIIDLTGI